MCWSAQHGFEIKDSPILQMNPLCGEAIELPRVKEVVLGPGFLRVPAALIGPLHLSLSAIEVWQLLPIAHQEN